MLFSSHCNPESSGHDSQEDISRHPSATYLFQRRIPHYLSLSTGHQLTVRTPCGLCDSQVAYKYASKGRVCFKRLFLSERIVTSFQKYLCGSRMSYRRGRAHSCRCRPHTVAHHLPVHRIVDICLSCLSWFGTYRPRVPKSPASRAPHRGRNRAASRLPLMPVANEHSLRRSDFEPLKQIFKVTREAPKFVGEAKDRNSGGLTVPADSFVHSIRSHKTGFVLSLKSRIMPWVLVGPRRSPCTRGMKHYIIKADFWQVLPRCVLDLATLAMRPRPAWLMLDEPGLGLTQPVQTAGTRASAASKQGLAERARAANLAKAAWSMASPLRNSWRFVRALPILRRTRPLGLTHQPCLATPPWLEGRDGSQRTYLKQVVRRIVLI